MTYRSSQRSRAISLRNDLFRDPGDGVYKNKQREFALAEPALNLWPGIREDALAYFSSNNIGWWDSGDEPTGHLLSSQISCINHLYFLRQREDLATGVLKGIDPEIRKALKIDSGYVEFEKVGKERLGGEEHLTRGANCTSVDALMLGEDVQEKRILFLIEWKYTESYGSESKLKGDSGVRRMAAYKGLLDDPDCPIACKNLEDLFYEPFYQLMRQSLLGWEMSRRREYGAEDWRHVHVIPDENRELRDSVTSPGLIGKSMGEAWKGCLREAGRYISVDPRELLQGAIVAEDTRAIAEYLGKRYWD